MAWCLAIMVVLNLAGCAAIRPQPAVQHQLILNHHEFLAWDFVAKPGATIAIANQSEIAHSIYITAPDGKVTNLGVQLPGATVYWKIPPGHGGEYLMQCWIHPIIRATLKVQDD